MSSKKQFEIVFQGDPFDGGEIDVRDLAPALLSFSAVIEEANRVVNGSEADVRLKLTSTDRSSFVAVLSMDVSWMSDILSFASAHRDEIADADALINLIIKGASAGATVVGGAWAAILFLKGRRPSEIRKREGGLNEIIIEEDGREVRMMLTDKGLELLADRKFRKTSEAFATKTRQIGSLRQIRFRRSTEDDAALTITPAEAVYFTVPEDDAEPETTIIKFESWLRFVSVHLEGDYKWRFSDGGERPFTATVEHRDFLNDVSEGKVSISSSDALRCRLREEQTIAGAKLTKEVFVEEVLEYRPGERQLRLI